QTGGELTDAADESNVNISVSRYVAQALAADRGLPPRSREAALTFIGSCLNPDDDGYFFTPEVDDPQNKAGHSRVDTARSYGTTTADAVLAQLAWGVPRKNPQIRAALRWLEAQPSLAVVPGFPRAGGRIIGAEAALRFYYWAALAQVTE